MAFPTTPLDVDVEIALGADLTADPSTWVWTDATDYVFAGPGIVITRGARDGVPQAPPSTCDFTVDNADGRWTPSNPTGAWYGQLRKNTPIRVVTNETSASVRWTGFLSSLPPRWDPSENFRYVPVQAAGIMQRLQRQATPAHSALARMFATTSTPPVAYWPGEDGSQATAIAEYFGGAPMKLRGQVVTLSDDGPSGSLPLPEFTTVSGVTGIVKHHPPTGSWAVACIFNFPAAPTEETVVFRWYTSGSLPIWQVTIDPTGTDTIHVEAVDSSGVQQLDDSAPFFSNSVAAYDTWLMVAIKATQNGTGLDYEARYYDPFSSTTIGTGTLATQTVGAVAQIGVLANSKSDGMHAGHFAVWHTDLDISTVGELDYWAIDGYLSLGEWATHRADRLGIEEGVQVTVDTQSSDPATVMGPQSVATFLDLLRECEAACAGRLFEHRDPTDEGTYLYLRHSDDFTNQNTSLTLDHDAGNLAPPFEPTDDDQSLINDVTATRLGASGTGSSARVIATAGEHSASLVPSAVGTYADSVSVNVALDDYLVQHAGWRVNLGTHDGLRFPVVTLDFARNPSLIASWITCEIGSRITITNPPPGIAPDDIELFVEGWTEIFGPKTWRVQLNCSPYKPWHGFRLAETSGDTNVYLGRLAEDEKCALRVAVNSSATSFLVDPNYYRWTTAADDFPLDIRLGGEVCTLSAIATTAVTFVGVGTATHGSNTSVTPGFPAGTTTNDVLFVFAAIRNSGTGTVDTPTGYTRLPVFAATTNVGLFAKVDGGSEVAPSVSFTGGVANATTSAVMFAFRGIPTSLEDLGDAVVDSVNQLNASAANIAYGGLYSWQVAGCVQLILAWKQDDFTSIAVPATFTEMIEASSITGDDQSLYIAYRIDTTPAVVNDSSLAVTGGAAAISRSAVVALAGGFQTFTVSARSVNGVTKSHAAGTKIAVDDPSVLAL